MAEMLWKPVVLLGDGRDMNCKAVVFDMDGVILDSEQLVVKSWQKTADKYGIEDIESFCMAALGLNREAAKKLFVQMYKGRCGEGQDTLDEERYESLKGEMVAEFHRAAAEGELVLKPGVTDMLKMLRDNCIPCALATSTRKEVVTMELINLGVIDYFDKLVCGDMVDRSKPAPDIFLKACEELGVESESAWAVEDSYNGVRAAYAAGMKIAMIPDLVQPDDEMRDKADFIFKNMNEFQEYILESIRA